MSLTTTDEFNPNTMPCYNQPLTIQSILVIETCSCTVHVMSNQISIP